MKVLPEMKRIVKPKKQKKRLDDSQYTGRDLRALDLQVCNRCIYDEGIPDIEFDENGVCNYCHKHDKFQEEYQTGSPEGEKRFEEIVDKIKQKGKNKKYDCVIGVSGGTDSSYLLYKAKQMGLDPLAVHYDNTWNTSTATQNIRKVLDKLDIDLYTHVVNNQEIDDIFKSFFKSGVPELDAATDLALAEVLYQAASKHDIDYIFNGHSYMSEGISPTGSFYFDGAYIKDIHDQYGTHEMETYPLMNFSRFMRWTLISRIKRIRPLWYIQYSKEDAKEFLSEEFGWEYYGGHHLENRLTQFMHSVYLPVKFGMDLRNNTLSAQVRAGEMSREEALDEYAKPPHIEAGLVEYFRKRLNISADEYNRIMTGTQRNFQDFKTYKNRFEKLKPLFYVLMKSDLVPKSFYEKYCFPMNNS